MIAARHLRTLCVWSFAILLVCCAREKRNYSPPKPPAPGKGLKLVSLAPGSSAPTAEVANPYEGNALAISEGKRLFSAYNCVGCHANGGGGMGPPLMDSQWIYGSDPQNIFATIVEGRPNGMPSFGGRIPDQQVWQLVAYVRSLSGNESPFAMNGRPDQMQVHRQDQSLPHLPPQRGSAPHP
ncbi:MAG TPA: c-type cytochrome [Thermoanaerobaculia bacterium]|jgi:cytochrome c oxidase cbb3-type subunit 3|nr:c-type cytochrome [Thermoanaerobaculia bacterium]